MTIRDYIGLNLTGSIDPYWHFSRTPSENYDRTALRLVPITVTGIKTQNLGTKNVVDLQLDPIGGDGTIRSTPKLYFKYIGPAGPKNIIERLNTNNWREVPMGIDAVPNGDTLYGLNLTPLPVGKYSLKVRKRGELSNFIDEFSGVFSIVRAPIYKFLETTPSIPWQGPIPFRLQDEWARLFAEWLIKDLSKWLTKEVLVNPSLKPTTGLAAWGAQGGSSNFVIDLLSVDLLGPAKSPTVVIKDNLINKIERSAIDKAFEMIGNGVEWLRRKEDASWEAVLAKDLRKLDKDYFADDRDLASGNVVGLPPKLVNIYRRGYDSFFRGGYLMHTWPLAVYECENADRVDFDYRFAAPADIVSMSAGDLEGSNFSPVMTRWRVAPQTPYRKLINSTESTKEQAMRDVLYGDHEQGDLTRSFESWLAPYQYELLPGVGKRLNPSTTNDSPKAYHGTGLAFPLLPGLSSQPNPLGLHIT